VLRRVRRSPGWIVGRHHQAAPYLGRHPPQRVGQRHLRSGVAEHIDSGQWIICSSPRSFGPAIDDASEQILHLSFVDQGGQTTAPREGPPVHCAVDIAVDNFVDNSAGRSRVRPSPSGDPAVPSSPSKLRATRCACVFHVKPVRSTAEAPISVLIGGLRVILSTFFAATSLRATPRKALTSRDTEPPGWMLRNTPHTTTSCDQFLS
jgi:hypothetical protein